MKKFTGKAGDELKPVTGLVEIMHPVEEAGRVYGADIGLDVHKETIAVAVAECGRDQPVYLGEIANRPKAVRKLIERLSARYGGERLLFSYEAGPCGYVLYRQIIAGGHACEVVAPSLIPQKAGDRVKTDRRDALGLARFSRAGELSAVWVPDEEQEAIRDLTRVRRADTGATLLPSGRALSAVAAGARLLRCLPMAPIHEWHSGDTVFEIGIVSVNAALFVGGAVKSRG